MLEGEAYGTYKGEGRCIHGTSGGNLRERDYLQDLGVDGRVILRWYFKAGCGIYSTGSGQE